VRHRMRTLWECETTLPFRNSQGMGFLICRIVNAERVPFQEFAKVFLEFTLRCSQLCTGLYSRATVHREGIVLWSFSPLTEPM
jgi:hypothetical protein